MTKEEIENLLCEVVEEMGVSEKVTLKISSNEAHGHYTTPIALQLAKTLGISPKKCAEQIAERAKLKGNNSAYGVSSADPGFVNIVLSDKALADELKTTVSKIKSGIKLLKGEKINIEFVSANPTGRLHIGHGRGAFYGDALANILKFSGANVAREYYINDSRESGQIKELGKTARGEGEQYKTNEVEKIISQNNFSRMNEAEAGFLLGTKIQEANQNFIEKKLGVHFDTWYSEEEKLRAGGKNEKTLSYLKEKNLTYEKDGAVWIKTSEYGDDEDRVVVRSDGTPSYFLSDISYHADKFGRGYDTVIDVWGADHHGHVKRMQAIHKMLGWKGKFKIFITQLVSLKGAEGVAKMSKRAGNVIYLEDLVEELGLDVVRWFFSEKSLNTHMDFDMALAKEQSEKNPVFYAQYSHARACSIEEKVKGLSPLETKIEDILKEKNTRALVKHILSFPDVIGLITEDYSVNRLTTYVYELANHFARFYGSIRVIEGDKYNTGALELTRITRSLIAECLKLLGISAPEKM